MTHRERILAVLNYEEYDRLPLLHFGFWPQTLAKWAEEGHIPPREAENWSDGNLADRSISAKLLFDGNWAARVKVQCGLRPPFEHTVLKVRADGSREVRNEYGMVVLEKPGVTSIPSEIEPLFRDRVTWEKHYAPRLGFSPERVRNAHVTTDSEEVRFVPEGVAYLNRKDREHLVGLHCGSLFGEIRNWLGLRGVSYLAADDRTLFQEVIDTVGELCFRCTKEALATAATFDFGHFWEDICFRSGPLIDPALFKELICPHYKRITGLLKEYGVSLVSVDCDGKIDALVPLWLAHGVNVMFPIEVGVWNASIAPWRAAYGRELRGVGGMDKRVFARDRDAVDAEIERLRPLVQLGGYIPCPDHRIAPDAHWDLVQYYCHRFRETFG